MLASALGVHVTEYPVVGFIRPVHTYEHRGEAGGDTDGRVHACGGCDNEFFVDFGFLDAVFGFQSGMGCIVGCGETGEC